MNFDDSDMKIAPEKLSVLFDSSEGAASAFLREKTNGNMDKARRLGGQFAAELTAGKQGVTLFGVGEFDNADTLLQRKVLFAYIVGQVVDEIAPNSIVAQSAMSAFYETIEEDSAPTYALLTDTAVFSLYSLSARTMPEDPCALGRVFARLCAKEDDAVFMRYGCELAEYFSMYCTQLALRAQLTR